MIFKKLFIFLLKKEALPLYIHICKNNIEEMLTIHLLKKLLFKPYKPFQN